jgi:ABC-type uncharacterized transport system involved in gliding motility auxiliary subunit
MNIKQKHESGKKVSNNIKVLQIEQTNLKQTRMWNVENMQTISLKW